ncbi:MAG: HlyD family efflux transporter periplasmic adaptor subunit, partial [Oscillospiraceae bacterium]|nr:HlyD family efflux transporter periplasmic adaptor subunit [Oscillospiraceae bacterium]
TPRSLESLSPTDLDRVTAGAQPAGAFGKLVLGETWYYVTAVPERELKDVKTGDTAKVSFAHDLREPIEMRITHIGQAEDGRCVLVLSCGDYIRDVTMMRGQSADISFRSYAGLRVPKEAVHVREDGKVGVYVLESAAYKWKTVEILYDNGESYIVRLDKSSTSNLWPGDDIIVDDKDAYNGKVVL